MKIGDMIKFPFDPKVDAYGIIISKEGDLLNIEYKNPNTKQFEMVKKKQHEIIKIGNK